MRARSADRAIDVDVVVNARRAEVPPALRQSTEKKVAHIERFASDVRLIEVDYSRTTAKRDADAHTCEILVHLKKQLVKGSAAAAEPAAALDLALDKVVRQMRRLHERRAVGRQGGPHRAGRASAMIGSSANGNGAGPGDDGEADDDALAGRIVKTKRFATKPMDPDEAALQMELLGHDFFLFTSADTGRAAVVYRRRDGRLGLIEATG